MVLEIVSDAGQIVNGRDADRAQVIDRSDTRE